MAPRIESWICLKDHEDPSQKISFSIQGSAVVSRAYILGLTVWSQTVLNPFEKGNSEYSDAPFEHDLDENVWSFKVKQKIVEKFSAICMCSGVVKAIEEIFSWG